MTVEINILCTPLAKGEVIYGSHDTGVYVTKDICANCKIGSCFAFPEGTVGKVEKAKVALKNQ